MSSDPRRLADYGESLRGTLKDALDAERGAHGAEDAAEAARLARIEAKFLAAVGAAPAALSPEPKPAPAPPAPAPPPAAPAPPAAPMASPSWFSGKGPAILATAAVLGAAAFFLSRSEAPAPDAGVPRVPSAIVAEHRPLAASPALPTMKTVSPSDLPTAAPSDPSPVAATPGKDPSNAPSAMAKAPTNALTNAPTSASDTEEIALLARAHDALRGKPAESLELCRQHETKFASGHFAQEREAVAIEALVYLGRRAEAEARWETFRSRYPTSSHRVHLESLFSGSTTNPPPPAR